MVTFDENENPEDVLERAGHTTLTRFFELCASDAPENQIAKSMLYKDIPKKFTWKDKRWVRRTQYRATLGRLIHVSPRDTERFFMRMLLCHRRGPTSFEDLRAVDGVVCSTYREAALRAGYLEDDAEWVACMTEAAAFQMLYQLRELFCTLLVYSMPADVRGLWDQFFEELSRDIAHERRELPDSDRESVVLFETVKSINELLKVSGYAVSDFDLPQMSDFPRLVLESLLDTNTPIRRERSYDQTTLQNIVREESNLNEGQRTIFEEIIAAVEVADRERTRRGVCDRQPRAPQATNSNSKKLFFIDGPGGTGKSTLLCHLLARVRLEKKIATAVASSGIASLLLMAETVNACIKSSELWIHFKQVHLTQNMRVGSGRTGESDDEVAAFSAFLLKVGEGRHDVNTVLGKEYMKLPREMLINAATEEENENEEIAPGAVPNGMKRIIDEMYADINNPDIATDEYFANRTILTTTNEIVRRINEAVADRLHEVAREYLSVDSVEDDDGSLFEQEVLHSVNINGIPPHRLALKKGIPIMMMRNLNPDRGLCNETRLRIVDLKPHVIRATIMTGERRGQEVLIPRIIFVSDDQTRYFPFCLRRKQFPVQPAFAMTINKAQGQTVHNLGLYLASPCFSHGQLHVALSRVTSRTKFKALIDYPELEDRDGVYTKNIVYTQIFDE